MKGMVWNVRGWNGKWEEIDKRIKEVDIAILKRRVREQIIFEYRDTI